MGLLCSDSRDDDRKMVSTILEGVCQYWDIHATKDSKSSPEFTTKGVDRICRFAEEHVFTQKFFPTPPGPFKRAAALVVLVRHLECITFINKGSVDSMITDEEVLTDYKAKFAFYCIAPTLKNCRLADCGDKLLKTWAPATNHLRAEMIAWLKWLESPSEGSVFDVPRLCRAIMALAMIVEQSYYISGNKIVCDVMNKPCHIAQDDGAVMRNLLWDMFDRR